MPRLVVASQFRWDEYPGLRPGRIFSGSGDVSRSPLGESHLVASPEAAQTLCGRARSSFQHDFPETASLEVADPCALCWGS